MGRMSYIIVGVASGALGAIAGAVVAKIVEKKKYAKKLDEVNETMSAVKDRKKVKVLEKSEETEGVGAVETPDETPEKEPEDSEEDEEEAELRDHLGPYRPSEDHPFLITSEDFEANDGRSKVSVYYYQGDDTAYDVIGHQIDIENELGASFGNLDEDRFLESEDGVVYIRNHRESVDYAVDLYPGNSGLVE